MNTQAVPAVFLDDVNRLTKYIRREFKKTPKQAHKTILFLASLPEADLDVIRELHPEIADSLARLHATARAGGDA
jgi:hypothetical protein